MIATSLPWFYSGLCAELNRSREADSGAPSPSFGEVIIIGNPHDPTVMLLVTLYQILCTQLSVKRLKEATI